MDFKYVIDNDLKSEKLLTSLGYDLDSLFYLCKELLILENDLAIEPGDFKDLLFRLKNRHNFMNGKPPELKTRSEDSSPAKITFQPSGSSIIYNFIKIKGQDDVPYKEIVFYCELCGKKSKFYKKEIKAHTLHSHKS